MKLNFTRRISNLLVSKYFLGYLGSSVKNTIVYGAYRWVWSGFEEITIHESKIRPAMKHVHVYRVVGAQQSIEIVGDNLSVSVLEFHTPIVDPPWVKFSVNQGAHKFKRTLGFKAFLHILLS